MSNAPVLIDSTSDRIFTVRGKRVILDSDLAELYGVPTKRLNEQVRRNPQRFPPDFAFLLTPEEWEALRSQIATLKTGRARHRKFLPYAFTEHGALMAASVLIRRAPSKCRYSWFVRRRPTPSAARSDSSRRRTHSHGGTVLAHYLSFD